MHGKVIMVITKIASCIGFFADAYDLFIIGMVMVILNKLYEQSTLDTTMIAVSVTVGAVLGQIVFGFSMDYIGRKKVSFATIILLIFGGLLSSAVFDLGGGFYWYLTAARFLLGIGIGGEYPLSATLSCEHSSEKRRGYNIAATFSIQGLGNLCGPLIVLILIGITSNLEIVWRIALGIGCIPAAIGSITRCLMGESPKFDENKGKILVNNSWQTLWMYKKQLIGTSLNWFLFDILFYGQGIFVPTIESFLIDKDDTVVKFIVNVALTNLITAAIALPGYFIGLACIECVGRKYLQFIGFAIMAILYIIIGFWWDNLKEIKWLFVALYGLTFTAGNAGPNTTTFVLPAELFPTSIRGKAHAISAASGKIGACVGILGLATLIRYTSPQLIFVICAVVAVLGACATFFFTDETKGEPLPEDEVAVSNFQSMKQMPTSENPYQNI